MNVGRCFFIHSVCLISACQQCILVLNCYHIMLHQIPICISVVYFQMIRSKIAAKTMIIHGIFFPLSLCLHIIFFSKTDIGVTSYNNVIRQCNSYQFSGLLYSSGHFQILSARPRISAWMVVQKNDLYRSG